MTCCFAWDRCGDADHPGETKRCKDVPMEALVLFLQLLLLLLCFLLLLLLLLRSDNEKSFRSCWTQEHRGSHCIL